MTTRAVPALSLIAAAFAVGCESATLPTAALSTPVSESTNASATTVVTIPVTFTIQPGAKAFIQLCVGETVDFVGDSRLVAHQTELPDGSMVLDLLHFNGQGAVALGESTGATYRVVGADSNPIVLAPSGGLTATFGAQLLVVGAGEARSFMAHILQHITITPDGAITALVDLISIECR